MDRGLVGGVDDELRVAERDYPARAGRSVLPWAVIVIGLAAVALWILSQPMDMRGMGFAG